MSANNKMPLWVELGMGAVKTRKTAINLVIACVVFALIFIPFPLLFADWTWIDVLNWSGLTLLLSFYYWLCVRWIDKHGSWQS